jgi:hypothetical protein
MARPHYNKAVTIVQPALAKTRTEWNKRVVLIQTKIFLWSAQVSPYVHLAATKTRHGFALAKPYTLPVWRPIKGCLSRALTHARALGKEFVDPHVTRIWEKVVELGSRNTTSSKSSMSNSGSSSSHPLMSKAESKSDLLEPQSTAATSAETTASGELPAMSPTITPSAPPESDTSESISAALSSVITDQTSDTVASTSASNAQASSSLGDNGSVILDLDEDEIQLDLDDFYKELELEEVESVEASQTQEVEPEYTLTEEERLEKQRLSQIEVAKKRANIEGRHTEWEEKQKEAAVEMEKTLRESLVTIRKDAVADLNENEVVNSEVESLVKEAAKYLKSTELYLKNLKKEDRDSKEKIKLWERITSKVAEKFQTKLGEAQGVVGTWYMDVLSKENEAVWTAPLESM